METRYKLTNQDLTTYNGFQWKLNEWKETNGKGELCTSGWLHCYSNLLLAVLLNPIHANITNPKLFKCEVEGNCKTDLGLKEGWTRMRIIEEIPIPQINLTQKVAFGILCSLEVYKEKEYVNWATDWLSGKDRTKKSAKAISAAATYAATATAAANIASYDANVAVADAAAYYAAFDDTNLDLIKLAEKAMTIK